MYRFENTDCSEKYEARYWNSQGTGIAIVACVTKGIDWAAYIGAIDSPTEEGTLEYVAAWGNKLMEEDARHFFPDIELRYRK